METEVTIISLAMMATGFLIMIQGINLIFVRLQSDITRLETLKDETAQLIKETDRVKESGSTPKVKRGRPSKTEIRVF